MKSRKRKNFRSSVARTLNFNQSKFGHIEMPFESFLKQKKLFPRKLGLTAIGGGFDRTRGMGVSMGKDIPRSCWIRARRGKLGSWEGKC